MIEINYTLSQEDFLNYQLYHISLDEHIAKRRTKDRYKMFGLSMLFGIVLLTDSSNPNMAYFFFVSSILFFLIYPWWSAWFYKRTIKEQIVKNHAHSFPHNICLAIKENMIEIKNLYGESSLHPTDIKMFIETEKYFFIDTNKFTSIILPKKDGIDINHIRNIFKKYTTQFGVPFTSQLNWKWK